MQLIPAQAGILDRGAFLLYIKLIGGMDMQWYVYAAFIALALVSYFVIVDVKTRKGIKEKKAAARKAQKEAAKKSKSAKKKKKGR